MAQSWGQEHDVVVVGSGGGALVGAYVAAQHGLEVTVVEKTNLFGGTTAYSGAGLWFPGNQAQRRAGVIDSVEQGRTYIRATVGDQTPVALQDAYLEAGPKLVELLERNEFIEFQCVPIPDYFDAPGRLPGGRHIGPVELKGEVMGDLLDVMRPRVYVERLGVHEDRDVLIQGQALVGRLLLAATSTGKVNLQRGTEMKRLLLDGDRVVGIEAEYDGRTIRIGARCGVLLAAGGFERNEDLRRRHQDFHASWTMGVTANVGQAVTAAAEIGAATDLLDEAWWCSSILFPDGQAAFFYGVRGGGIMVNGIGKRFANESMSYDKLGRAMRDGHATGVPHLPSYWILDARFEDLPAIVSVPTIDKEWFLETGTWRTNNTITGLATDLGMPPDNLVETVERFNRFAATGVDDEFHRGEDEFDRYFGDGTEGPNPCLIPLDKAPFLAVPIVTGDLGTKGGVKTDEHARVLRTDGTVIPGLYAAGNTMASIMGHVYPGPGAPIGTSMVFSYLAALDMAGTG